MNLLGLIACEGMGWRHIGTMTWSVLVPILSNGDAVDDGDDSDDSDTGMPSISTLTADDKARIKRAVPASGSTGTNKIITATCARVYRARPGEEE